MALFALGLCLVAAFLGFMAGLSESPVAGIAITAIFGALSAAIAAHQKFAERLGGTVDATSASNGTPSAKLASFKRYFRSLGLLLTVFAVSFARGLGAGIKVRLASAPPPQSLAAPWKGLSMPSTPLKAIDWMIVQRKLLDIGYSEEQVRTIYVLELEASKLKGKDPDSELVLLSRLLQDYPSRASAVPQHIFPMPQ